MGLEGFSKSASEIVKNTSEHSKSTVDLDIRIKARATFSEAEKSMTTDKASSSINLDKRITPKESKETTKSPESKQETNNNLSDAQRNELTQKGVSPGMLDKITYSDGIYKVKTVNSELANQKHPETQVPYKKRILDILGTKIEGIFPEFQSKFDVQLPENLIIARDKSQFDHCNSKLKEAVNKNPELRKQFTERQLAQIENGNTPSGFVWNHNEKRGKMELVDFKTHEISKHTGGKAIWGGGKAWR